MSEAEEAQTERGVHQPLEGFPDGLHIAPRVALNPEWVGSILGHQHVQPGEQQDRIVGCHHHVKM